MWYCSREQDRFRAAEVCIEEAVGTLQWVGASKRASRWYRDRLGLRVNTCRMCDARLLCWRQQDIPGGGRGGADSVGAGERAVSRDAGPLTQTGPD